MQEGLSLMQGILLGAVQGVTEFLPVSSSGHLVLVRELASMPAVPLLFDVLLHVATLVVVCFYFRKRLKEVIVAVWHWMIGKRLSEEKEQLNLAATVIAASVCTAVVALLLDMAGATELSARQVLFLLLVSALILVSSLFFHGKGGYEKFSWHQVLITGIGQGFGTLAGISRSGITITAALASGMDREHAGEYAFILSIPAIIGALLFSVLDFDPTAASIAVLPLVGGSISACITGLLSLRLLLWMVKQAKLWYFSIYLAAVGILGLLALC